MLHLLMRTVSPKQAMVGDGSRLLANDMTKAVKKLTSRLGCGKSD